MKESIPFIRALGLRGPYFSAQNVEIDHALVRSYETTTHDGRFGSVPMENAATLGVSLERGVDDVALVGVHGPEGTLRRYFVTLPATFFRQALEVSLALFAVIFCADLHAGTVLLAAAVDAVIRQLLDGA